MKLERGNVVLVKTIEASESDGNDPDRKANVVALTNDDGVVLHFFDQDEPLIYHPIEESDTLFFTYDAGCHEIVQVKVI